MWSDVVIAVESLICLVFLVPVVYNMYPNFRQPWVDTHFKVAKCHSRRRTFNLVKLPNYPTLTPNFFFLPSPHTIWVSWDFSDQLYAPATPAIIPDYHCCWLSSRSPRIRPWSGGSDHDHHLCSATIFAATIIVLPLLGSLCHDRPNTTDSHHCLHWNIITGNLPTIFQPLPFKANSTWLAT